MSHADWALMIFLTKGTQSSDRGIWEPGECHRLSPQCEFVLLIVVIWQEVFHHVILWNLVKRQETLNCPQCLCTISFLPFLLCFLCILRPHEEHRSHPYMSSLGQRETYKDCYEASVFIFLFSLGTLLVFKAIFQVPVVLVWLCQIHL